jgi:hypothetical protein
MEPTSQQILFAACFSLVGWFGNNLLKRITRQTDSILPDAITSIQKDLSSLNLLMKEYITRDKLDYMLKDLKNDVRRDTDEIWAHLEGHVKDKEVHK